MGFVFILDFMGGKLISLVELLLLLIQFFEYLVELFLKLLIDKAILASTLCETAFQRILCLGLPSFGIVCPDRAQRFLRSLIAWIWRVT